MLPARADRSTRRPCSTAHSCWVSVAAEWDRWNTDSRIIEVVSLARWSIAVGIEPLAFLARWSIAVGIEPLASPARWCTEPLALVVESMTASCTEDTRALCPVGYHIHAPCDKPYCQDWCRNRFGFLTVVRHLLLVLVLLQREEC